MSPTVIAMCAAGTALAVVGAFAAKATIAEARGLDRIVALSSVCFAVPLAVFGALHLFDSQYVIDLVPA